MVFNFLPPKFNLPFKEEARGFRLQATHAKGDFFRPSDYQKPNMFERTKREAGHEYEKGTFQYGRPDPITGGIQHRNPETGVDLATGKKK